MSYREKIEKYKRHLLSEAERLQVEEDIEKVDAISEYLAEKLEEELDFGAEKADGNRDEESDAGADSTENLTVNAVVKKSKELQMDIRKKGRHRVKDDADEFEKYVQRAIRKSFAKMAMVVGAVLLAVVLFIQFGLSPIMDSMYYNPAKRIEVPDDNGYSATVYDQMGIDFDIYAALTRPELYYSSVHAVPMGYGNYSFTITPTVAYGSEGFDGVGGQIRRGKMELYDPNYLKTESVNTFACYGLERGSDYGVQFEKASKNFEKYGSWSGWRYSSMEMCKEAIEKLQDNKTYTAYVSFKQDLTFDEMNEVMERVNEKVTDYMGQPWAAVHVEEDNRFGWGYMGYPYGCVYDTGKPSWLLEKYPELSLRVEETQEPDWDKIDEKLQNEEIMKQHFVSMLNYMNDQQEFVDVMEDGAACLGKYRSAARYVEENGLSYYGFVCRTTKKDMLAMMEDEDILGIVPREWN